MRVLPAIDLREGACVQLVGGDYRAERVRLEQPLEVAKRFIDEGLHELHVVDLDAATGRGENRSLVESIAKLPRAVVQVGGGLRSRADIERLFACGAARAVVGTRAIEDAPWCAEMAHAFPDKLVVAADVKGGAVVVRGWEATAQLSLPNLLERLADLALAGVLVTAVDVEGRLGGPDLAVTTDAVANSTHPVYASGGIGAVADLKALARAGAAAAVVGMAFYTGALSIADLKGTYLP